MRRNVGSAKRLRARARRVIGVVCKLNTLRLDSNDDIERYCICVEAITIDRISNVFDSADRLK